METRWQYVWNCDIIFNYVQINTNGILIGEIFDKIEAETARLKKKKKNTSSFVATGFREIP